MGSSRRNRRLSAPLIYLLRPVNGSLDSTIVSGRKTSGAYSWRLVVGDSLPPPSDSVLLVLPFDRLTDLLSSRNPGLILDSFIAYGTASQLPAAFAAGALDFLREPWEIEELSCRVHGVLKRAARRLGIEADDISGTELSAAEERVLRTLLVAEEKPVSREALCQIAFGRPEAPGSRRLDMFISRLRKKLGDIPGMPVLRAIRGEGFRLDPKLPFPPVDKL